MSISVVRGIGNFGGVGIGFVVLKIFGSVLAVRGVILNGGVFLALGC